MPVTLPERELVGELVWLAVREALGDADCVSEGLSVELRVDEKLGVPVALAERVCDGDLVVDGVNEPETEPVFDEDDVPVGLGVGDALGEAVAEGVRAWLLVADALRVCVLDGVVDCVTLGEREPLGEPEGLGVPVADVERVWLLVALSLRVIEGVRLRVCDRLCVCE